MAGTFLIDIEAGDFIRSSGEMANIAKIFERRPFANALAEIGEYFDGQIAEQFATEGGALAGQARVDGGYVEEWPLLSDSWAEQKAREAGFSYPMLRMYGSYQGSWGADDFGDDAIIIHSTEDDKAMAHQLGISRWDGYPAREVLALTEESVRFVDETFLKHFDGIFAFFMGKEGE